MSIMNVVGPFQTVVTCTPGVKPSNQYRALRDGLQLDYMDLWTRGFCEQWGTNESGIFARSLAVLYPNRSISLPSLCALLERKGGRPASSADLLCFIGARHYEPTDAAIIAPLAVANFSDHYMKHRRILAYAPSLRRRKLVSFEVEDVPARSYDDGFLFRWGEDQRIS